MFCKHCGQDIGDVQFCPRCGKGASEQSGATISLQINLPSSRNRFKGVSPSWMIVLIALMATVINLILRFTVYDAYQSNWMGTQFDNILLPTGRLVMISIMVVQLIASVGIVIFAVNKKKRVAVLAIVCAVLMVAVQFFVMQIVIPTDYSTEDKYCVECDGYGEFEYNDQVYCDEHNPYIR